MKIRRHKTREVKIGRVKIGGNNPIAIQSMTKVPTKNYRGVISEILRLEKVGCDIVRLAVRDEDDASAIAKIKKALRIPLVADIHFNWKLAMSAIKSGADKIRLNPGNIYEKKEIGEIVKAANARSIPIRVGINSGSIPKIFRYDGRLRPAQKLVQAALDYIKKLEDLKFNRIVVSLKASSVLETIETYQSIAKKCDYPLHLGLTATGFSQAGRIKSALALGILLFQGIGDTLRVSLTDAPEEEVRTAQYILAGLGLRSFGPEIISCPACGRTEVDIEQMVNELQERLSADYCSLSASARPAKLAVMGCMVNGPGEAEEADLAIVFGKTEGMLYKNSKPLRKVSRIAAVDELIKEWRKYVK
jgi:(E)-4-hydroxy-3-methylbut-2-enyl-diphosphate synthase